MDHVTHPVPADQPAADNGARPDSSSNDTVNILLVDDDPRNLDVLETILDNPEYRLIRARDAQEALRALMAVEFALVVLDVRLPGMNGLELAQLIKQRRKTRNIPILFMTAYYREDEHVLMGYGAGAVDYLSKPFNPSILRSKVAVFVDLYRKSRALEAEVAERTQAERQVRELAEQLQRRVEELAAANAELESFSYSVSHDLRAPLRQVAGFVSLLKKTAGASLDPGAAEYLPLIQDSVARMGQLIDNLLAFSRFGRVEMRTAVVPLRGLVEQARRSLLPATAGRAVEWKICPLPEVEGDPAMLLQVLINLIDNALKFSRTRETVQIEIGSRSAEGEWIVFVRDNGIGFDSRYAGKLFGVFQRLHSAAEFEGTGIGLANVRRIIQRHGGRTWAESVPEAGTTVFFSLPRSRPPYPEEEEPGFFTRRDLQPRQGSS